MTECSDDSGTSGHKENLFNFQELLQKKARPSNVAAQKMEDREEHEHDDSILGQVHLDMAKYHEICRFTDDGIYDRDAAFFHLKCAADCGIVAAIVCLAKMYFGMPHDILTDIEQDSSDPLNAQIGFRYMEDAARAGDRASMVFVARAYDTGMNLDDPDKQDAGHAIKMYEKICERDEVEGDSCDWGMDDPPYLLKARMAEMWLEGGNGLDKDPNRAGELYNEAAESAMNCMKGKLANKYYMMAEEAYGQCEEEEE